mgnify:CR=1 FL=1
MEKELITKMPNKVYKNPPGIAFSNFDNNEILNAQKASNLLSITILLGNQCNLECLYCYRDAGCKNSNHISLNIWKQILVQAKELGAKNVWIPGSGEPMLDDIFFDGNEFPFLKICENLDLSVLKRMFRIIFPAKKEAQMKYIKG